MTNPLANCARVATLATFAVLVLPAGALAGFGPKTDYPVGD